MLKEDFVIQSNVKRILVRSNIDYSEIDFATVRGVVYFRGFFRVKSTSVDRDPELKKYLKTQDYIIKTLYALEKKVKSILGVKDIIFQFLNWEKERGRWIRGEEEKRKNKP